MRLKFIRSRLLAPEDGPGSVCRDLLKLLLCGTVAISITLVVISVAFAHSPRVRVASLAVQTTPEPTTTPSPAERLAAPPMSDPPTQTELGHYAYWFSCMVCHGDRGQGLTDEWRNVNPPQDRDCWQSKCHAPNHPPEGFEIPRYAPAIIGPETVRGYRTAADMYEYLRVEMPWAYPSLLPDEEYWQITAFLADVNGIPLGKGPLGPDNAVRVLWRRRLPQIKRSAMGLERAVTAAVLVLLLSALTLRRWVQAH